MFLGKVHRQHLYSQPVHTIFISEEPENEDEDPKKAIYDCACTIRKIIQFGSSLKFLPFHWNPEKRKVTVASNRDRILVNINLSWIFSYVGLKLYCLIYKQIGHHSGTNKVTYSMTGSMFFVMFFLALFLHLNNVWNLDDIACTVNTYCHRIRGHLGDVFEIRKSTRLLDLLWSIYIFVLHGLLLLSVPFFVRNKTNLSLHRHFGGKGGLSCLILLLVDLYSFYAFSVIIGFYVFLIVDCAAVVEKLSKSMTGRIHGITHICMSTQRIQELRFMQRSCHEVQIAFVSYKSIMEPLVLPLFLGVATILSSLGLFTVIKFFGELGIFFSMVLSLGESLCISVTSLGLSKASSISLSSEFLQKELCHLQLVPKRNKHELKVVMKCIRPIRFRIGNFFPVSKQTATDFLETLCSWLTTLLLTYG